MSALANLNLVADIKQRHMAVIQVRRNKLSSRLWEQLMLAKSQIDGTPFVVTRFRSYTDRETGQRKQIEIPKRLKPWWFVSDEGKVCFSVKYGSHILELAQGKMSVQVDSATDLVKAIEQLKKAVEEGVLDVQIEKASKHLSSAFKS
jgi:capsid portal protein